MRISFVINSLYYPHETFHKKVANRLRVSQQYHLEFLFTEWKGHAKTLANQACGSGADLIIACGGDGTLHEVINGCLYNGQENLPIIGLFPSGTGNDFSRNFKFSGKVNDLNNRLNRMSTEVIDLGMLTKADGSIEYFHNETSLGFGAEVIRSTESGITKGKSYLGTIIKTFRSYKPGIVKLSGDGFDWEGIAFLVVIANGKYMGGGLSLAPKAVINDSHFNITIVSAVSLWEFLIRLPAIIRAKPVRHQNIFYFETTKLEIDAGEKPLPAEADGELIQPDPVSIACQSLKIAFLS